ncbi:growth hormone-inducible transmembrane protein, partial [Lecanoromycetidae sp. Uapishka_2]
MAFVLRRPFAISSAIKQLPKSTSPATQATRAFHSGPKSSPFASKPIPSITSFTKARYAFQEASSRSYIQPSAPVAAGAGGSLAQRLLYGAAIVGGTVVATNMLFNRETREDGGMAPFERRFLNETFMHTGLGIGIIGVAAQALHRSGWSVRLMQTNPWVILGVGLATSIGTMYGTFATSPDNYVQKYALWTGFNVAQAAILSPLLFLQPALLARAGLYTVAMMGSIAFVGATAKQEKYLYLGGPLLAGVAVVAVSGFAPLVLPATAARTLMWTERIWLYGGLAVFGGFTLYDTQKILHHARLAERGMVKKDVVNESISLELDFLNIFIRMVQILGMRQQRK